MRILILGSGDRALGITLLAMIPPCSSRIKMLKCLIAKRNIIKNIGKNLMKN